MGTCRCFPKYLHGVQIAVHTTLAQAACVVHVVTSCHTMLVIEDTHCGALGVGSYLSPAAACRDGI